MKALVMNCTRNSGLTIMRALSKAGWTVAGADDRVYALGLRSRFAAAPYELLPAHDHPTFPGAFLALLDRTRPDVLIPSRGIQPERLARDLIHQRAHSLTPPADAFGDLNDKVRLLEHCAALGIPAPRMLQPEEAILLLTDTPGSQVVVKPRRDVGGGRGVHFVSRPGDLRPTHDEVMAEFGGALITEYVAGATENLRAVHLLFDSASRLVAFFVLRKLRIWPSRVGVTVAAVSTHETELVDLLLPLFRKLRWQGPADAELKIDARDGQAKLLEINPRFSGAIHFPIACGVNMPLLYCRAALGERLGEMRLPSYQAGLHYLDPGRWLAGVGAELLEPGSRWTSILRRVWTLEMRQPRVQSVHALTDPGALLGKLLAMRP